MPEGNERMVHKQIVASSEHIREESAVLVSSLDIASKEDLGPDR